VKGDFQGTVAPPYADLILLLEIAMGLGLLIGALLARMRSFGPRVVPVGDRASQHCRDRAGDDSFFSLSQNVAWPPQRNSQPLERDAKRCKERRVGTTLQIVRHRAGHY
jgi:hypothetical protein